MGMEATAMMHEERMRVRLVASGGREGGNFHPTVKVGLSPGHPCVAGQSAETFKPSSFRFHLRGPLIARATS